MTVAISCPDRAALERLLEHGAEPGEMERVTAHLATCARCAETVEALLANDRMAAVLRGARVEADEAPIQRLRARLVNLRPDAADAPSATTPPVAAEGTAGDAPPPLGTAEDGGLSLAPPHPDEIGRLGGYRILKELGRGGMGVVYQAEDLKLKRIVALKAMLPYLAADAAARQRFLREAQAMAAVHHDHVVTIYQVEEADGVPFLAMEFLQGMPLDQWMKGGRKPTTAQVLRIGREIAEGLAAAHERGLIHRDVKPGNIWLDSDHQGRVKILDFGLARPDKDDVHLTRSGAIVGTPAYMAPEQARGDKVDARCDLFSLGCVLYRLCTGRMPFRGDTTLSLLTSLALDNPKPVREINADVPEEFSDLVTKLLEKDPARRPASAREVVEALQGLEKRLARERETQERTRSLLTPPAPTIPVAAVVAAPRPARRRCRVVLVAAAAVLLAGLIGLAALIRIQTDQGDYVINTDDPDFFFQVHDGAVLLKDSKNNKTYTLKVVKEDKGAGAFDVDVTEVGGELSFRTKKFTIKRGETARLTAWFEPKAVAANTPAAPQARSPTYEELAKRPSPLDRFKRENLTLDLLALAGGGDPAKAAAELIAVLGKRFPAADFHAGPVWAAAVSPDGKTLATGGEDRTIRLWDLAAWKPGESLPPCRVLEGHANAVWSLVFSPDGKSLASGGNDGVVILWDPASGKKVRGPLCRAALNSHIAFSPDGAALAAGQEDGSVAVYDTQTGAQKAAWPAHADRVQAVAFSPDGKWVASCDGGDDVLVTEWATGKAIRRLRGGAIRVAFSPDGATLYATTVGTLRAWDTAAWREQPVMPGHTQYAVGALAVHPGGRLVATGASDGSVVVRDVPTGRARVLAPGGEGETHRVESLAFTPEGRYLVAASANGSVWVLRTPELPPPAVGPPSPRPIDLLALVDPTRDAIDGQWVRRGSDLAASGVAHLELPYQPPEEYDLTVQFTVGHAPGQRAGASFPYAGDRNGACCYLFDDAGQLNWSTFNEIGFMSVGGFGVKPDPAGKQELRVEVRRGGVRLFRNGREWKTFWDGGERPRPGASGARDGGLLGLQCFVGAVFHKAEVVELSGPGWYPYAPLPSKAPVDDAWIKQAAALPAEKQVEAVVAKLKELNPGFDGIGMDHKIEGGVATELHFSPDQVKDVSPLRALTELRKLSCRGSDGKSLLTDLTPLKAMRLTWLDCNRTLVSDLAPLKGMPLMYLDCGFTHVSDLSPLVGMPLTYLDCSVTQAADLAPLKDMKLTYLDCNTTPVADLRPLTGMTLRQLYFYRTQVSDLSALKGMKLEKLDCSGTKVRDLAPLKGMKLTYLHCAATPISDLAPLTGMPLTELFCDQTTASDLSPLQGMPLKTLWCDFKPERDAAILRAIKTLETINGKPAAEFWKDVDAKKP